MAAEDDTAYYVVAYITSGGETYYSDVKPVTLSELDDGVSTIAMLMDLLTGESLDNVSGEVMSRLQASLCTVSYEANGGTGTSYQDGASVTPAGNMTLYAQWKPIQYAISYDLRAGRYHLQT